MQVSKSFVAQIKQIIARAKDQAIHAVDTTRVLMYWQIGKVIFNEEQKGKNRAEYGMFLIQSLSDKLEKESGSGFSARQLELFRQFYRSFPIANALRSQFSWTHYRLLMRIENKDKKSFYIAETEKNNWTARQLERQVNSHLFERLLVSNNVKNVLAVPRNEKQADDAKEIIKDPIVLEFLGLKRKEAYYEKDLETSIITHLQEFLLELGNGFSFVARQKRIHLEGDDFFIDLVFYNRLLKCFILIEIKTHKLNHTDIGQLQMYVNYYDRKEKLQEENSTIGILLCADKNEAVVKFTLPEKTKNIIASKYQIYLPSKKQLIQEVKKEIKKLNK